MANQTLGDLVISAPHDTLGDIDGDLVVRVGGVERARIKATGLPTGFLAGGIDPIAVAAGMKAWGWHPAVNANTGAPASQTVYATPLWLPPGTTLTGIVLETFAGAGAVPTGFFVGVASPTKMLAQSGNLNNSAALTSSGQLKYALSAPYVTSDADSPSGLYYVAILKNGAFGTTDVQFARMGGLGGGQAVDTGLSPTVGVTLGTALATLPANGSAVTPSTAAVSISFWAGAY